jgi:hypothetical protein
MGTSFDRPKEALADRYALEREIGAGAWPRSFSRTIRGTIARSPIKVMDTDLAGRIGPERFLKEIQP